MNKSVTVRVPAKINLQLTVGPLRPDGYHDLVTVFHAVSLFDEVTVTRAEADSVTVAGEGAREVPEDADNLALRAVRALREATGEGAPARVAITKRIPVAAGMAGGSADCAAALVACNQLWGTGLSQAELSQLAAALGSDVPFALLGGTVVGRGRGEQLTSVLAAQATYHWVLAYAAGHLSTPLVYETLDKLRGTAASGGTALSGDTAASGGTMGSGGTVDSEDAARVPDPALSGELMAALRAGDPARLGQALSNDLQAPAVSLFPALRKTLNAGSALGALGALVSGSGPTCFFLARDAAHATDLAVQLSGAGVCRTVATATGPAPGAEVI